MKEEPATSSQPEDQQPPTPTDARTSPPPIPSDSSIQEPIKSKKKLIIIGSIVAGVLAIAAALFFILFFPKLQAEATASSFMTAIKNNDDAKMTQLSGEGGDAITTRANDGLEGATYELSSTDSTDKGFNVHFNVSNSSVLNSVTIVVESNQVTNVVIDSKTTGTSATPSTSDTTPKACLTLADLNSLDYNNIDELNPGDVKGLEGYYFKARSTTYDSSYFNNVKAPASVYKKFSDKAFSFSLYGSADQAKLDDFGTQLANDRAAKVKKELIAAGIPADLIAVEEIGNARASTSSSVFRHVGLQISVPANCIAN